MAKDENFGVQCSTRPEQPGHKAGEAVDMLDEDDVEGPVLRVFDHAQERHAASRAHERERGGAGECKSRSKFHEFLLFVAPRFVSPAASLTRACLNSSLRPPILKPVKF